MLVATALAAVALLGAGPAAAGPAADPCRAAAAPVARPADLPKDVARALEAYRASWRRACEQGATPDVASMLGDAEVLAQDARTSRAIRTLAAGVLARGDAWPLPGIRSVDGGVAVDWAAFVPYGARGSVDDVRFWRGAAVAADGLGEPVWLEPAPEAPGGECIRLGATPWPEIARALQDMEAAEAPQYAGHARALRDRLLATLTAIAKGPRVCGCVRGAADDGLATLAGIVGAGPAQRRGTGEQRELGAAGADALQALRTGRVQVRWLRETPGAEPVGCPAP